MVRFILDNNHLSKLIFDMYLISLFTVVLHDTEEDADICAFFFSYLLQFAFVLCYVMLR